MPKQSGRVKKLPDQVAKAAPTSLKALFRDSERIVVLAADHRYFGVVAGLEKPGEVLSPLLPYVDVLMTDPGVWRHCFQKVKVPVILRASGCTTVMDVPVPGYLQETARLAYRQRTGRDFEETFNEYKGKIERGGASR